jgi:hypothetical protein
MPACCTYMATARLQPCTLQAADELAVLVHVHLATVTRVDLALGELLRWGADVRQSTPAGNVPGLRGVVRAKGSCKQGRIIEVRGGESRGGWSSRTQAKHNSTA